MTAAAVLDQAPETTTPPLHPRRELAARPARHGWATHSVALVVNDDGELVIEIPGDLYAGIAGWRTQTTWLAAFSVHPRLLEAVRRYETCVATVLRVMTAMATYADPATGRGIRAAHATIARQLGVSPKVVQRCCWAAEDLGLLERVLDGSDMTLAMRGQIRDHYGHHDRPTARPDGRYARRGTQSKLPNVYAATLPRWLATQLPAARPKPTAGAASAGTPVDEAGPAVENFGRLVAAKYVSVHPPVGGTAPPTSSSASYSRRTTFGAACGQRDVPDQRTRRTAATRPTKAHRRAGSERPVRRLDPAVERFARALRADLLGFRDVSLYRICPGLSLYVSAGLSVSDLRRGLDDYLAAVGRTWLTSWRPDQAEEQARYLIGMLNRARLAGYIRLPAEDTGEWW
ncbi:MAG: hypothetical protein ACR2MP_09535 [Streptosporangiaceae bacterium]